MSEKVRQGVSTVLVEGQVHGNTDNQAEQRPNNQGERVEYTDRGRWVDMVVNTCRKFLIPIFSSFLLLEEIQS